MLRGKASEGQRGRTLWLCAFPLDDFTIPQVQLPGPKPIGIVASTRQFDDVSFHEGSLIFKGTKLCENLHNHKFLTICTYPLNALAIPKVPPHSAQNNRKICVHKIV